MKSFIDYYEVLGVSPSATPEEIKKAYQKIAKTTHPDMTKGLSEEERQKREQKFIAATAAKEVLENPQTRAEYDKKYQRRTQPQNTTNKDYTKKATQNQQRHQAQGTKPSRGPRTARSTQSTQQEPRRTDRSTEKGYEKRSSKNRQYYQEEYEEEETSILIDMLRKFQETYYDIKRHEKPFSKRMKNYQKHIQTLETPTILTKGFVIFANEAFYSTRKLKLRRNDTAVRYMIRNRGKALVAATLAISLLTGMMSSAEDKNELTNTQQPEITQMVEEEIEPMITIIRNYNVGNGDTLSQLAYHANCTQKEIKDINDLSSTTIYYQDTIKIPYHIPEDEIGRYTTVELYQGENLYEFADKYETTPESLKKLNEESIIAVKDTYTVTQDTIVVPTFAPYNYEAHRTK